MCVCSDGTGGGGGGGGGVSSGVLRCSNSTSSFPTKPSPRQAQEKRSFLSFFRGSAAAAAIHFLQKGKRKKELAKKEKGGTKL